MEGIEAHADQSGTKNSPITCDDDAPIAQANKGTLKRTNALKDIFVEANKVTKAQARSRKSTGAPSAPGVAWNTMGGIKSSARSRATVSAGHRTQQPSTSNTASDRSARTGGTPSELRKARQPLNQSGPRRGQDTYSPFVPNSSHARDIIDRATPNRQSSDLPSASPDSSGSPLPSSAAGPSNQRGSNSDYTARERSLKLEAPIHRPEPLLHFEVHARKQGKEIVDPGLQRVNKHAHEERTRHGSQSVLLQQTAAQYGSDDSPEILNEVVASSSTRRRGGFGSHGKSSEAQPRVGRQSYGRSESPSKPLSKVKEAQQPLSLVQRYSEDELEDVESPEGPFSVDMESRRDTDEPDIEYTGENRSHASGRTSDRRSTAIRSPEQSTVRPRKMTERMRGKDGLLHGPASTSKTPARSSIPSAHIPTSSLAQFEFTCIVPFGITLLADSLTFARDQLVFNRRVGNILVEGVIDLMSIMQATINKDGHLPTMSIEVDLTAKPQRLERLYELVQPRPNPGHLPQQFFIFVAFRPASTEAKDLLGSLGRALRRKTVEVHDIDDHAAHTLRQEHDPRAAARVRVSTRDRLQGAQHASAGAVEQRGEQRKAKRRESDSSYTGATTNNDKGKGKAGADDPKQTRLSFTAPDSHELPSKRAPVTYGTTRKSSRIQRNGNVDMTETESDVEIQAPPAKSVPVLSAADRQKILFDFPLEGRSEVQITGADRYRVQTDDFLNDILLEFGLKYVISDLPSLVRERVQLFSSFFYEKLSSKKGKWQKEDNQWPAYDSVKKWTKNYDIFDKDYLVVPINENFHWYLAVIYNPRGILELRSATPEMDTSRHATRARTSLDKRPPDSEAGTSRAVSVAGEESSELSEPVEELAPLDGDRDPMDDNYGEGDQGVKRTVSTTDDIEDDPMDRRVPDGLRTMSLGADERELAESDKFSTGGWIQTPTTAAYGRQTSPQKSIDALKEAPVEAAVEAHDAPASKRPRQVATKIALKEDREIWQSNRCFILTFDSLGGAHRTVATHLQRWLQFEARDKKKLSHDRPSEAEYVEARCPQQPNFSDCGLYLIHYVRTLLRHSEEVIKFIQRTPARINAPDRKSWEADKDQVWRAADTPTLRRDFAETIDQLTARYRSLRDAAGDVPGSDRHVDDPPQDESFDVMPLSQEGAVGNLPISDPAAPDAPNETSDVQEDRTIGHAHAMLPVDANIDENSLELLEPVEIRYGVPCDQELIEAPELVEGDMSLQWEESPSFNDRRHGGDDPAAEIDPSLDRHHDADIYPWTGLLAASAASVSPNLERSPSPCPRQMQPEHPVDPVTPGMSNQFSDNGESAEHSDTLLIDDNTDSAAPSTSGDGDTSMDPSDESVQVKPAGRRSAPVEVDLGEAPYPLDEPSGLKSPFDNFGSSIPGVFPGARGPPPPGPRFISSISPPEREVGASHRLPSPEGIDQTPLAGVALSPTSFGDAVFPGTSFEAGVHADVDDSEYMALMSSSQFMGPDSAQKRKASSSPVLESITAAPPDEPPVRSKYTRIPSVKNKAAKDVSREIIEVEGDEVGAPLSKRSRNSPASLSNGEASFGKSKTGGKNGQPLFPVFTVPSSPAVITAGNKRQRTRAAPGPRKSQVYKEEKIDQNGMKGTVINVDSDSETEDKG